jgi:hypothetical protein
MLKKIIYILCLVEVSAHLHADIAVPTKADLSAKITQTNKNIKMYQDMLKDKNITGDPEIRAAFQQDLIDSQADLKAYQAALKTAK